SWSCAWRSVAASGPGWPADGRRRAVRYAVLPKQWLGYARLHAGPDDLRRRRIDSRQYQLLAQSPRGVFDPIGHDLQLFRSDAGAAGSSERWRNTGGDRVWIDAQRSPHAGTER